MYFDLNKKDKKIALAAIDKSLEAKYKEGIKRLRQLLMIGAVETSQAKNPILNYTKHLKNMMKK